MGADAKGLAVTILGRVFRVACPESEQKELLEAVSYLDIKMCEIRDTGKVVGIERIAIMAALNVVHELLATRVGEGFDVGEFKRRMRSTQEAVERALSDQDGLF